MSIIVSVLASQGALRIAEWFGDVPTWAERLIVVCTAAAVSVGLWIWRKKHEG